MAIATISCQGYMLPVGNPLPGGAAGHGGFPEPYTIDLHPHGWVDACPGMPWVMSWISCNHLLQGVSIVCITDPPTTVQVDYQLQA